MLNSKEEWNTYFRFKNHSRKFKIPVSVLVRKLANQKGKCAICKNMFLETPHLDHSHATGSIRGYLCGGCNIMLGKFDDQVKLFQKAIKYLQKYQ